MQMTVTSTSAEIQRRLRHFWGVMVFSLGILWGFSSLVYTPIVVLTSARGGTLSEVVLIFLGGLLVFLASIRALYRRRAASFLLLVGGSVLLAAALALQYLPVAQTSGAANRLLTLSSGILAVFLGAFGWITDARGWPVLRDQSKQQN